MFLLSWTNNYVLLTKVAKKNNNVSDVISIFAFANISAPIIRT